MTRRELGLLITASLLGAEPSIEGEWVWERLDYVRTPPFQRYLVITTFEFQKKNGVYTGHMSSSRSPAYQVLSEIPFKGNRLAFFSGRKGGGGEDILTQWSGTIKSGVIEGSNTFVDSNSYGEAIPVVQSACG